MPASVTLAPGQTAVVPYSWVVHDLAAAGFTSSVTFTATSGGKSGSTRATVTTNLVLRNPTFVGTWQQSSQTLSPGGRVINRITVRNNSNEARVISLMGNSVTSSTLSGSGPVPPCSNNVTLCVSQTGGVIPAFGTMVLEQEIAVPSASVVGRSVSMGNLMVMDPGAPSFSATAWHPYTATVVASSPSMQALDVARTFNVISW